MADHDDGNLFSFGREHDEPGIPEDKWRARDKYASELRGHDLHTQASKNLRKKLGYGVNASLGAPSTKQIDEKRFAANLAQHPPVQPLPPRLADHLTELERRGIDNSVIKRIRAGTANDSDTSILGGQIQSLAREHWADHTKGAEWKEHLKRLNDHGTSKAAISALHGLGEGTGFANTHVQTLRDEHAKLLAKHAAATEKLAGLQASGSAKAHDVQRVANAAAHAHALHSALQSIARSEPARLRELHKAYNWHRLGTGLAFDKQVHTILQHENVHKWLEGKEGRTLTGSEAQAALGKHAKNATLVAAIKKSLGGDHVFYKDFPSYSKDISGHITRSLQRRAMNADDGSHDTDSSGKSLERRLIDTSTHAKFAKVEGDAPARLGKLESPTHWSHEMPGGYRMDAHGSTGGHWDVTFNSPKPPDSAKAREYGLTGGQGHSAVGVMRRVHAGLSEFLSTVKPHHAHWTAATTEPSRVKLYDRAMPLIAKAHGYGINTTGGAGKYHLIHPDAPDETRVYHNDERPSSGGPRRAVTATPPTTSAPAHISPPQNLTQDS